MIIVIGTVLVQTEDTLEKQAEDLEEVYLLHKEVNKIEVYKRVETEKYLIATLDYVKIYKRLYLKSIKASTFADNFHIQVDKYLRKSVTRKRWLRE